MILLDKPCAKKCLLFTYDTVWLIWKWCNFKARFLSYSNYWWCQTNKIFDNSKWLTYGKHIHMNIQIPSSKRFISVFIKQSSCCWLTKKERWKIPLKKRSRKSDRIYLFIIQLLRQIAVIRFSEINTIIVQKNTTKGFLMRE